MTINYAVATHSFLVVVSMTDQYRVADYEVLNGPGHHYGIALEGESERSFLAKHRSTELMRFNTDSPFGRRETVTLGGGLRAVHQIAHANGGVYIANSYYNSLVFEAPDASVRHEYFFNGHNEDVNHVNSVFPCGRQVFALLNNRGKRPSEVAVLEHDQNYGFRLVGVMSLWHTGCHNILVKNGILYYNASAQGRVVAVDVASQRRLAEVAFSGHTKGMSLREAKLVIGVSDVAPREARRTSRGHLAVLRASDLSLERVIDLNFPGLSQPIGNVNEVRCISGGELGHASREPQKGEWSTLSLARHRPVPWMLTLGRLTSTRVRRRLTEGRPRHG